MKFFRKAVVIIHGFTGNLYDNEYLMNYLEYDSCFDVYAKTLPGHNKDRFSDASVDEWKKSVDEEIRALIKNGYRKIYVVGHSMGGILASYVASKHREVKKLVLVNAAFDYLNFKQNKKDIKDRDLSKYSHLWQKALRTSPLMINEFRKLVKESNDILPKVKCDVLILRSMKDEIVPMSVGDEIYETIGSNKKYLTSIKDASHVVLKGDKKEVVSKYIRKFLKGGTLWRTSYKKEI